MAVTVKSKTPLLDQIMDSKEIAAEVGCTLVTVVNAIRRGDLVGRKKGKVFLAEKTAVTAWKKKYSGRRGRPRKSKEAK